MAKNNSKKFVEKRVKADGSQEYIVNGSPSKTLWGKVVVALIIAGTILVPVAALIFALLQ
jgi:hypothetical protein